MCFLKKNFLPCWKRVGAKVKKTLLFIQDNASSQGSCYSCEWLGSPGFIKDLLIVLIPLNPISPYYDSPDLNLIENLWLSIQSEFYKEEKQCCSLDKF